MRILVADDEPHFRTLIVRAVRAEFGTAAEIVQIGDPPSLHSALASKTMPELLITDFQLKWEDGFGIMAAVRSVNPLCVAVMCTGTGDEDLAVRAIKSGFDDYVVKSARMQRLLVACRLALDRQRTRRELEENRDLLTRELYHRLHNNLQLVITLIAFTGRAIADADAREKLEDVGRRVQSLSLLQERLYRGGDFRRIDFATFLSELVNNLVGLDTRAIAVKLQLEPGALPVDTAIPLGLIANELITNALKHAFSSRSEGELSIIFRGLDERQHILEIADDGVGVSAEPREPGSSGGLGMRLVHRLVQQISGRIELLTREGGGSRWRVTFRLQDAGP